MESPGRLERLLVVYLSLTLSREVVQGALGVGSLCQDAALFWCLRLQPQPGRLAGLAGAGESQTGFFLSPGRGASLRSQPLCQGTAVGRRLLPHATWAL